MFTVIIIIIIDVMNIINVLQHYYYQPTSVTLVIDGQHRTLCYVSVHTASSHIIYPHSEFTLDDFSSAQVWVSRTLNSNRSRLDRSVDNSVPVG